MKNADGMQMVTVADTVHRIIYPLQISADRQHFAAKTCSKIKYVFNISHYEAPP